MKRELLSALLLLSLCLCAGLNLIHADRLTDQILEELTLSEEAANAGDYQSATAQYQAALTRWRRAYPYASVFLRHPDVDAATGSFYDLQAALQQQEPALLSAAFSQLRYRLQCIDAMEHLSLGTVF